MGETLLSYLPLWQATLKGFFEAHCTDALLTPELSRLELKAGKKNNPHTNTQRTCARAVNVLFKLRAEMLIVCPQDQQAVTKEPQ